MEDKREIGKKIWKLFSKNYNYSQIAKELGISKSVVSNVINYCSPPSEETEQNIKELKETYSKIVKQIQLKNDEIQEKLLTEFSFTTFSFVFLFSILTYAFTAIFLNALITNKSLIAIFIISVIEGAISFFLAKFINKKDLKNEV